MNVCFAFHSANTISVTDFLALKSFLKLYIQQQAQPTNFAAVSFSNQVITELQFTTQQSSWENLFNSIDNIVQQSGSGANAAAAIQQCANLLPVVTGLTAAEYNQIIFITDAVSSDTSASVNAVRTASQQGVGFTIIGVGSNVNSFELQQMATYGRLFSASSFSSGLFDITNVVTPVATYSCHYPYIG